jgi:phosphopantetheinyl transferase
MPSPTVLSITPDCTAVLHPISDTEPTLRQRLTLTTGEEEELARITHPEQRVEWLACRVAVRQLVEAAGWTYAGLQKDEYGKPHLVGSAWHISISQTGGLAAAVLHRTRPVGIDIEPMRDKFTRVVPRILSETEIHHAAGNAARLAVYWCAKESLYKLYGKRQLTFRQHLLIDPFADGAEQLTGHVRLPDHEEQLTIRCFRIGPGLLAVAF